MGDQTLSEERFCVLCHNQVWFGAFGTTQRHVDYSPNEAYVTREKVCKNCIDILNKLPMEHHQNCIEYNQKHEVGTPGECICEDQEK